MTSPDPIRGMKGSSEAFLMVRTHSSRAADHPADFVRSRCRGDRAKRAPTADQADMAVGVVGGISAMTTDVVPARVVPKPRRRLRESTPVLLVEDSPFNLEIGVAIEIRRREALCGNHTPIVALMASVVEDGRRRCLAVGWTITWQSRSRWSR